MYCHVEVATICPATTLISSWTLSKTYTLGSHCRFADSLALWHELTVDNASHIEKHNQHDFAFFGDVGDFHSLLKCLVSRSYSKIYVSSSVMIMKHVRFILKMLDNVLTHLHVMFLLIIILQTWHHFRVDFPHVQIFGDNLPNSVQPTCNDSFSQPMIATYYLPYLLNCNLIVEGLLFPELPFISFCTQKTSAQHGIISIHLLKHFKYLWQSFPQLDWKFQIYSLLGVHYLFLWTT